MRLRSRLGVPLLVHRRRILVVVVVLVFCVLGRHFRVLAWDVQESMRVKICDFFSKLSAGSRTVDLFLASAAQRRIFASFYSLERFYSVRRTRYNYISTSHVIFSPREHVDGFIFYDGILRCSELPRLVRRR